MAYETNREVEAIMDYRCPHCRADLRKRKLSQIVITKMEIDCSHCRRTIRLNIHGAEMITVLVNFGLIVGLAVVAYRQHSQQLMLLAFVAAMAGAAALPVLENTVLRRWPRYVPVTPPPDPQRP